MVVYNDMMISRACLGILRVEDWYETFYEDTFKCSDLNIAQNAIP